MPKNNEKVKIRLKTTAIAKTINIENVTLNHIIVTASNRLLQQSHRYFLFLSNLRINSPFLHARQSKLKLLLLPWKLVSYMMTDIELANVYLFLSLSVLGNICSSMSFHSTENINPCMPLAMIFVCNPLPISPITPSSLSTLVSAVR